MKARYVILLAGMNLLWAASYSIFKVLSAEMASGAVAGLRARNGRSGVNIEGVVRRSCTDPRIGREFIADCIFRVRNCVFGLREAVAVSLQRAEAFGRGGDGRDHRQLGC